MQELTYIDVVTNLHAGKVLHVRGDSLRYNAPTGRYEVSDGGPWQELPRHLLESVCYGLGKCRDYRYDR